MHPLLGVNMDMVDGVIIGYCTYIMPFSLHVRYSLNFPCLTNPYLDHNLATRASFQPG